MVLGYLRRRRYVRLPLIGIIFFCIHANASDCLSLANQLAKHSNRSRINAFSTVNSDAAMRRDVYKGVDELITKHGLLAGDAPEILAIGSGGHADEWLPFLLSKPQAKITLQDPGNIVQDARFLKLVARNLWEQIDGQKISSGVAQVSPISRQKWQTVLGTNEITESGILDFLKSRVSILKADELPHMQFDLAINRLNLNYAIAKDCVKPGGMYWMVEGDAAAANMPEFIKLFGANSIKPLDTSPLSRLSNGQSYYDLNDVGPQLKTYWVEVPRN